MKLATYIWSKDQLNLPSKELSQLKSQLSYVITDSEEAQIFRKIFQPEVSVLQVGHSSSFPEHYISTWEELNYAATQFAGVTITAPLTFAADDLATFKLEHPDFFIFAEAVPANIHSPQSWYARPEDIAAYEGAIDVFIVPLPFVKFYAEGSLNDSLLYFSPALDIDNKAIPSTFVQHRLDCNQKCQLPNPTCHYCSRIQTITNQMKGLINNG